jgi:ubiquinone/menaquinone biosynthesis C-methylase UbiE
MTWDETINYIQNRPEYAELIKQAYLDIDGVKNVESFIASEELKETLNIFKRYTHLQHVNSIADMGAGNGMASVAFSLKGFNVSAIEPDIGEIAGTGAISKLIKHYNLSNLNIIESFGEKIPVEDNSFDIVYARQVLHHAHDLPKLMEEVFRILKPNGFFISLRDHVIYNEEDKKWFFESHPLQKYYGGENAFTYLQYETAIKNSGLKIMKVLKHYESVVNYAPLTTDMLNDLKKQKKEVLYNHLANKYGSFGKILLLRNLYLIYYYLKFGNLLDESLIPGRLITFIAKKQK